MQFGRVPLLLQCQFFTENEDWNEKKRVCRRGELILLITKKYLLIPSNLPTEPKTETGGGGITRCNFRPTSGLI